MFNFCVVKSLAYSKKVQITDLGQPRLPIGSRSRNRTEGNIKQLTSRNIKENDDTALEKKSKKRKRNKDN